MGHLPDNGARSGLPATWWAVTVCRGARSRCCVTRTRSQAARRGEVPLRVEHSKKRASTGGPRQGAAFFLEQMDELVPWAALEAVIEPFVGLRLSAPGTACSELPGTIVEFEARVTWAGWDALPRAGARRWPPSRVALPMTRCTLVDSRVCLVADRSRVVRPSDRRALPFGANVAFEMVTWQKPAIGSKNYLQLFASFLMSRRAVNQSPHCS